MGSFVQGFVSGVGNYYCMLGTKRSRRKKGYTLGLYSWQKQLLGLSPCTDPHVPSQHFQRLDELLNCQPGDQPIASIRLVLYSKILISYLFLIDFVSEK